VNQHVPALQRSLSDVVAEYDQKRAGIGDAVKSFEQACADLKSAAAVAGVYGGPVLDGRVSVYQRSIEEALLKSAWRYVYQMLNIATIGSAKDRSLFEQSMASPAPFTKDNVLATFGRYLIDPRGNILRGLAEVFCGLDQAYRSHEKMKIGVAGLPKRIVLTRVADYGSYGRERLVDMLNALAAYRGEPLIEHADMKPVDDLHSHFTPKAGQAIVRGLTIKIFMNRNAHVMFDKAALRDINKALAEYYGDVLPDCPEERPAKQASTAVSKDLAFYPTPAATVAWTLSQIEHRFGKDFLRGKTVLEPSCGDGRFLDALRAAGASVVGFEVDENRARISRGKGHGVVRANFLESEPKAYYDVVLMNPPFAGKHYAKHVRHAYAFLKPGGRLYAILPATARDHGLLEDVGLRATYRDNTWTDLPVGSFSESGTNINTVLFTVIKEG